MGACERMSGVRRQLARRQTEILLAFESTWMELCDRSDVRRCCIYCQYDKGSYALMPFVTTRPHAQTHERAPAVGCNHAASYTLKRPSHALGFSKRSAGEASQRPVPSAPPVETGSPPSSTPEHSAESTAPQTRQSLCPLLTMRHGEAEASHGRCTSSCE